MRRRCSVLAGMVMVAAALALVVPLVAQQAGAKEWLRGQVASVEVELLS